MSTNDLGSKLTRFTFRQQENH